VNQSHSIVFYPLWVVRYEYKKRIYQITADGESSDLLYGRAPGNNLYRVACLVASIMLGQFILTTSCRSMLSSNSSSDHNPFAFLVVCLVIMAFGFYQFRYGGEVKIEQTSELHRTAKGRGLAMLDKAAIFKRFEDAGALKQINQSEILKRMLRK
jgi:hypothetical protein